MNCVTQKLKPLTKNDLAAELIGREVMWNSAKHVDVKVGKRYEVIDINLKQELITIKDDVGDRRDMHIERFALPVKEKSNLAEDEKKSDASHAMGDCFRTGLTSRSFRVVVDEITYSCTLEFPNGETVTVPGPEGDDWNAETTRFDWPVVYTKVLSTTDRIKMHKEGSLVFHEYLGMLNREILKVRSITKWTRDQNYQPPEREETFEERAIRRYPSRMRG